MASRSWYPASPRSLRSPWRSQAGRSPVPGMAHAPACVAPGRPGSSWSRWSDKKRTKWKASSNKGQKGPITMIDMIVVTVCYCCSVCGFSKHLNIRLPLSLYKNEVDAVSARILATLIKPRRSQTISHTTYLFDEIYIDLLHLTPQCSYTWWWRII